MSTVVSLETFAVGFAGFCCVFYGILGISVICTSNCENSLISDDAGASIQLTPAIASFYCSLAIIAGYIIFRVRDAVGQVAEGISTFGSALRTKTVEGQAMRTFSVRFAVVLTLVFVVVVVFMKMVLLGPLDKCEPLAPEQAPFMFALRSTLKRMEPWVVGLGFALLASGLLFSIVETWYREGYAKRVEQGTANDEEYGWGNAIYDKYSQNKERSEKAWAWLTEGKGVTDKRTGEVLTETGRGPSAHAQHDGYHHGMAAAAAHGSAQGPPHADYHVEHGNGHSAATAHHANAPAAHHANAPAASSATHFGGVQGQPNPNFLLGTGHSQSTSPGTSHDTAHSQSTSSHVTAHPHSPSQSTNTSSRSSTSHSQHS